VKLQRLSRHTLALMAAAMFTSASVLTTQRGFNSGITTVALFVTVVGDGDSLTAGLSAEEFEVRDDGELRPITQFEAGRLPITMAVMLDDSPSAQSAKPFTKAAAAALIEEMTAQDRLAIGTFNRSVRLHGNLTSDRSELMQQLSIAVPLVSGTALWDAVNAGIATVEEESGRRVVLIISDGDDNSSEADSTRVAQQTLQNGVMIYAVGVRGAERRRSDALKELAIGTGGWFFELKTRDNLSATFRRVANELHNQYLIGFSPGVLDGNAHRVSVRVKRRGLKARVRTNYIAPVDGRHADPR
jgi:Ca-activated chloride channel family protein